jgi:5-methylcytosine-specific restriction endonuclease McrA
MAGNYSEANLNAKLEEIKLSNLTPTGLGVRGKGAFSTTAKTATFITEALESAPRCAECGARLHLEKATTVDHSIRKAEGGSSHSDNAQLMHPYCNSGIKEKRESKKTKSSKPDA